MQITDTIAAISSGSKDAAVGMVRISGISALEIADKVFVSKSGAKIIDKQGYTALFGEVYDEGGVFDTAVALIFRAPKSYTGENVVEITVHGGSFLTKKLLRAVLSAGARLAEAGEFTKRAYLNGKMSLSQAESVSALISAQGESQARAALSASEGVIQKTCTQIRDEIIVLLGEIAAYCDYPDEDIVDVSRETLLKSLNSICDRLKGLIDNFDRGRVLSEGVSTAIVGSTNVGKSTIMNLLSGYDKSIVTDIAGTTRDIVEDTVRVGEFKLALSDTAGIRETEDVVEAAGVEKAKKRLEGSALVLLVLDASRELTGNEKELISNLKDRNCVAVINKTDLEPKLSENLIFESFKNVVKISAKNGDGAEELISAIEKALEEYKLPADAVMLINERQFSSAKRAYDEICTSITSLGEGQFADMIGINLESAARSLSEISGENVSDAIVSEIFSKFCVGK